MPQQRDTSTDRLLNVIQVIQLGRKSGLLSVERGEGIQYEEGMVLFVNGQATEANAGQRTGLDAFNWLSAWQTCRFSFIPSTTVPTTTVPPPPETPNTPTNAYIDTNGRLQSHQIMNARQRAQRSTTGYLQAQQSLHGQQQARQSTNGHVQAPQPAMNRQVNSPPTSAYARPMRTRLPEDGFRIIEQAGFTRGHRHLFLLI
ncbi:MAG: DUF4388 domain-containing protein, partial [Ktedonobacteraceae bacterium]